MRRTDREIKDIKEIEAILNEARYLHLGLVDEDQPYVVPMNYAYTNGCLYLHCAREGYKLDLIKKNNKVCFQVDIVNPKINKEDERPCEWGMFYKSVIGQGLANIVTDKDEKVKALNAIVATVDSHKYTFSEASVDSVTIIRIDINQITGKKR